MRAAACVVAIVLAVGPGPAAAQRLDGTGWNRFPVRTTKHSRDIVVEIPGERCAANKIAIASLAGATLLAGVFGLYYHLDSRDLAAQVSADTPTATIWTPERQGLVEDTDRSRTLAIAGYTAGSALAIGLIVFYIATNPPSEERVITTTAMRPIVQPVPGGASLGAAWSF